ncbi:MAG: hypothetical protein DCC68_10205 [Planctomycetota bacterium]|nr:MAG: hypothetical protein DCC68_10205 [Planctomycetota bacterium]
MPEPVTKHRTAAEPADAGDAFSIDLRDRTLAAFFAWLLPGAGHAYQRRWGKSVLFFSCIMGTFLFGMYLGDCKVVYASWGTTPDERRLPYFLQVGVGLPAMPALVQANVASRPFGSFMAPPRFPGPGEGNFRARELPNGEFEYHKDELAYWNLSIEDFELGTVYTMIAGLLNVLAIYDAWAGPVMLLPGDPKKRKKEGEEGDKPKEDEARSRT